MDPTQTELWRDLEGRLRPYVARRVPASDVDDVMQDVLVRIHRGLDAVRDEQRLAPWVHRVARSAVIDHLRRRGRRAAREEATEPTLPPDDAREREHVAAFATLFISALPEPYRQALTLVELEGRTQREAAERAGVSVSGMKSRVQRGRRMLRGTLEDCCRIDLDARGRVTGYEPRPDGVLPDGCCS